MEKSKTKLIVPGLVTLKKSTVFLAALGFVTLGLTLGFTVAGLSFPSAVFISPLTVTGDVETVLNVAELQEAGSIQKIHLDSGSFRGVALQELLAKAGLQQADKICLVAGDGFTAVLEAGSLEDSYLTFSAANGWEVVNLRHPPSANAKMIREIIVVARESAPVNSFVLLSGTDGGAEILRTTVGRLYTGALLSCPYFEGRASVEHEGRSYAAEIYTRRRVFKLAALSAGTENDRLILLGEDGGYFPAAGDGFFELTGNRIAYLQPETREKLSKVCLAVVDPPAGSIMDVYYDARHYLEKGDDVLVLLLEGFDYSQYKAALAAGKLPCLQEKGAVSPALGLYPCEPGLWLEAMFTGLVPTQKKAAGAGPEVENLFTLCKSRGKTAAVVGAGAGLFADLEEQPVLQQDWIEGCRGSGDDAGAVNDATYADLRRKLSAGYGLLAAVFQTSTEGRTAAKAHSSAGREATAGAAAREWETVEKVDGYLRELASLWPGKIIVTALPAAGGKEGPAACGEKLFVPYLLLGEAGF